MDYFGVFDLGIKWDGYVSSAGAVVVVNNQYLRKTLIKKEDVRNLIAVVGRLNLTCEIVEPLERKLIYSQNKYSRAFYHDYSEVVPPLGSFTNEEVVGINLFCPKRFDLYIQEKAPEFLYYRYYKYAIDVMDVPHLKGDGVDVVLKYLGIPKELALGFGDDTQDISMAEHLPHFVCMGQGKEALKKVSEFVTTPVSNNGVSKALDHYGFVRNC
jgi:hydroxymethylpyrimidine pyrophosphatase-like HAD family hydrolase